MKTMRVGAALTDARVLLAVARWVISKDPVDEVVLHRAARHALRPIVDHRRIPKVPVERERERACV